VIGSVKTLALEDNPNWGINLAKRFLVALRATGQGLIRKFLLALKAHATTFTPVSINRHKAPPNVLKSDRIIARLGEDCKTRAVIQILFLSSLDLERIFLDNYLERNPQLSSNV
jgi:hypothetical protein